MDNFMFAIIGLLIIVLVSKVLNDKAIAQLSTEKKADLIDLFQRKRTRDMIFNISLLILFFGAQKFFPAYTWVNLSVFISIIFIFLIASTIKSTAILKKADFPIEFIRSYQTSAAIRFVGLLAYFAFLMLS
jgi:hypothetical protein